MEGTKETMEKLARRVDTLAKKVKRLKNSGTSREEAKNEGFVRSQGVLPSFLPSFSVGFEGVPQSVEQRKKAKLFVDEQIRLLENAIQAVKAQNAKNSESFRYTKKNEDRNGGNERGNEQEL